MGCHQFPDAGFVGRIPGRSSVPAARFDVDPNYSCFLEDNEVLGNAWLTRAHCCHDVSPGRRPVMAQIPKDFIAGTIAECGNCRLYVWGPVAISRLGYVWHVIILPQTCPQTNRTLLTIT